MFLDGRCSDTIIGRLGFAANLMNMTGSLLIPPLVSGKYMQRRWKWIVVSLQGFCALCVGAFTYFLYDLYPYANNSTNHSNNHTNRSGAAGNHDFFGPLGIDGASGVGGEGQDAAPVGMYAMGAAFCAGSFLFGGSAVIGLELASEIVFPVSEESAAAYMTLLYMVANIASMEAGNVLTGKAINTCVAVLLAICAIILVPIKVGNKRILLEEKSL